MRRQRLLRTAHRKWIFNQGIDDEIAKLRKADEEARVADENRLGADARRKAAEYANALQHFSKTEDEIPEAEALRALGLLQHVGVEVAGHACFTIRPAFWQALVMPGSWGINSSKRFPWPTTSTSEASSGQRLGASAVNSKQRR
jgi:hypothetical protein